MKKISLLIAVFLTLTILNAQTTTAYEGVLPKIDKNGVINKTEPIEGFNDPSTTIFFLARHSEKQNDDSNADLNAIGRGRAVAFTKILRHVKLSGVYSTDRPRTRNTANPTARKKKIPLEIYDAKKQNELADRLAGIKGENFFIIGHSNTIPQLVNYLTGSTTETEIPNEDYTRLYIISVKKIGEATMKMIRF